MGAWLVKYGDSIYGTRGGPWKPTKAIASTRKGNVIFVHLLGGHGDTVVVPNIPRKVVRGSLLTGGRVSVDQAADQITVRLKPALTPPERGAELLISKRPTPSRQEAIDTIVKLELDGSAMDLPPVELPSLTKASASNVFQNDERYSADNAFDNDAQTRWATDAGVKQAWIAVDFSRPTTFTGVNIQEAIAARVQKFEFQQRAGEDWKTIFTGETIGEQLRRTFQPVTASGFRLNILEASQGPTIAEIKLLEP